MNPSARLIPTLIYCSVGWGSIPRNALLHSRAITPVAIALCVVL